MKHIICMIALSLSSFTLEANATPSESALESEPLSAEIYESTFLDIEARLSTDPSGAAGALMTVINDPGQSNAHGAAYGLLGRALQSLSLPYSALVTYEKSFEVDMLSNNNHIENAIVLGITLDRSDILGHSLAKGYGQISSNDDRARVGYGAAKYAQQNGDFAIASAMLSVVGKEDPQYAQVKNLEGIIMSLQGNPEGALIPLLIAEQLSISLEDDAFRNTVKINLARAYFAAGNFPRAIDYYKTVDRSSPIWADAHFEQAWSYFRMNDMNSTLSMLHSHASPFFNDYYYPEAELLRIYSMFVMCKFPSAAKETDEFIEQNTPKLSELDDFIQNQPESIFREMRLDIETGSQNIPFLIRSRFLMDATLVKSITALGLAEKEMRKLQTMSGEPHIQVAMNLVQEDMDSIVLEQGKRILDRAQFMSAQLQEMLTDADMHKLDILEMEAKMLRQASITGKMEEAKRVVQRNKRLLRNERTWAFQGEYWADEVGYYRIKSKPECPANMFQPR